MAVLAFACAVVGLLGVGGYFLAGRRRSGSKMRYLAAVYNGSAWLTYEHVKRDAGGIEVQTDAGPVVYPYNVASLVRIDHDRALYVVAAEQVPLATHEALEAGRKLILVKHLFKGGGDFMMFFQIGSYAVPILICIYLAMSFGGVSRRIDDLAASTKQVQEIVSKPLVVQGNEQLPKPETTQQP